MDDQHVHAAELPLPGRQHQQHDGIAADGQRQYDCLHGDLHLGEVLVPMVGGIRRVAIIADGAVRPRTSDDRTVVTQFVDVSDAVEFGHFIYEVGKTFRDSIVGEDASGCDFFYQSL